MTILVLVTFLVALALLGPAYGADSRCDDGRCR
jgi:hypothetical protein